MAWYPSASRQFPDGAQRRLDLGEPVLAIEQPPRADGRSAWHDRPAGQPKSTPAHGHPATRIYRTRVVVATVTKGGAGRENACCSDSSWSPWRGIVPGRRDGGADRGGCGYRRHWRLDNGRGRRPRDSRRSSGKSQASSSRLAHGTGRGHGRARGSRCDSRDCKSGPAVHRISDGRSPSVGGSDYGVRQSEEIWLARNPLSPSSNKDDAEFPLLIDSSTGRVNRGRLVCRLGFWSALAVP